MATYVEKLGWRDEVADLIERHFEVVRVLLPDDQANAVLYEFSAWSFIAEFTYRIGAGSGFCGGLFGRYWTLRSSRAYCK
jgi:hypothetical protein